MEQLAQTPLSATWHRLIRLSFAKSEAFWETVPDERPSDEEVERLEAERDSILVDIDRMIDAVWKMEVARLRNLRLVVGCDHLRVVHLQPTSDLLPIWTDQHLRPDVVPYLGETIAASPHLTNAPPLLLAAPFSAGELMAA